MAASPSPSIEVLPVEIFHRIFDHLDAQTIVYSVRAVCHLFRSIVTSYNRYKFDFKIISKSNLHNLCRLIPPQHMISLTLYNNEEIPDQISFFTLNYRLRQLTHLRSIYFFGIYEYQLNYILKRLNLDNLTEFSLYVREYDERRKKTTGQHLSSIIAQPSLRKLELNIRESRFSNIQWSTNCRIESLSLNERITDANLFQIIESCPQLHRLIIKEEIIGMCVNFIGKSPFPQITSLALENTNMPIDHLESFLSLTPSLMYLKLIGDSREFDGKRWEEFIEDNLPHLKKFEFFINSVKSFNQTQDDLQLILQSFQSPFWIEHKKWFVACQFNVVLPRTVQIYSIPICKPKIDERSYSKICFLSTANPLLTLEHMNVIDLRLEEQISDNLLKTIDTTFPNVTKLRLDLSDSMSKNTINHLQPIFNLSQLIEVHLESSCFDGTNKDRLFNVIKLIDQLPKIISLTIYSRFWIASIHPYLNDLCSILPRQIKYLQMPISQVEQVEMIFERCRDLSIVKFETIRKKCSADITEWFEQNTIDSTVQRRNRSTHVWIGKKINLINENPKRIKLMNNELNS